MDDAKRVEIYNLICGVYDYLCVGGAAHIVLDDLNADDGSNERIEVIEFFHCG